MDAESPGLVFRFQLWGQEQSVYGSSPKLFEDGECLFYTDDRFIWAKEVSNVVVSFEEFYPLTLQDLEEEQQEAFCLWMFRE